MITIRPMKLTDLQAVMMVNRRCFSNPWSHWSIKTDLRHNPNASWVVVERRFTPRERTDMPLLRWLRRIHPGTTPVRIIGFASYWIVNGEMHISNIGIDPDFRGEGLGELLLNVLLRRSLQQGATHFTLEVRVSNTTAINLYRKYEYEIVARKNRYYYSDLEDAFEMATRPTDWHFLDMLNVKMLHLQERLQWQDMLADREGAYET